MRRVLITGASGFLGRHLAAHLLARGISVRSAVRSGKMAPGEVFEIGDIGPDTDWSAALAGCDAVVHAAAVVHRKASAEEIERVNIAAALRLAQQAAAADVNHFIFISSASVFGIGRDTPYLDSDLPAPHTGYAKSKLEAEQRLAEVKGPEVLILRPPMIYGRDAPGNFSRLLRLVRAGLPLPLASIRNRRALVHVDDAAAAVAAALDNFHPGTYAVTGPESVSTPQLARGIAEAMGKSPLLFPFPPYWIEGAVRLAGRGAVVADLTRSFTLQGSRFETAFNWRSSIGVGEGLRRSLP